MIIYIYRSKRTSNRISSSDIYSSSLMIMKKNIVKISYA